MYITVFDSHVPQPHASRTVDRVENVLVIWLICNFILFICPPTDASGEVALSLLPILLPPPVFKRGRRVVRTTVDELKTVFIDVKPVSNVPLNRNENINS